MTHVARKVAISAFFVVFSSLAAKAQQNAVAPPAPVPSQLLTSKKVFISNGGLDGAAFDLFRQVGNVNQPYNAFYGAVNSWGRYKLVSSPAEADLVFEIRFISPIVGVKYDPRYAPLSLTIYDAKTHFVLWTILAPVEHAFRKNTFVRNVNQGIAALMADLKNLQSASASSATDPTK